MIMLFLCGSVTVVHSRQLTGCTRFDHAVPGHLYTKLMLLSRSLGHLSSVYCVAFDRTGNYIFTVSNLAALSHDFLNGSNVFILCMS